MSIRMMSAVWEMDLPDSEKLIMLALADWSNDEGVCWPTVSQVAMRCSKSVRTVQAALKSLEAKGALAREMKPGCGARYTLNPRNGCTPAAAAPPQGTTPTPAAAAPHPRSGCTQYVNEPSVNVSSPPPYSPPPSRSDRPQRNIGINGTRLEGGWIPEPLTGSLQAEVARMAPGFIERELSRFRDHWAAQPGARGRKADWQATWRNWLRRAIDEQARTKSGGGAAARSDAERWPGGIRDPVLRELAGRGSGLLGGDPA